MSRQACKTPPSSRSGVSMWVLLLGRQPTAPWVSADKSVLLQDFPYNLEAGMEHHNVWNPAPLTAVDLEQVRTACALA